jgi:hypothetical protein
MAFFEIEREEQLTMDLRNNAKTEENKMRIKRESRKR